MNHTNLIISLLKQGSAVKVSAPAHSYEELVEMAAIAYRQGGYLNLTHPEALSRIALTGLAAAGGRQILFNCEV